MSSVRHYDDAVSFRQALEDRLKKRALDKSEDLQRLRQQVAFDRFVMRIQRDGGKPFLLYKRVFLLRITSGKSHNVAEETSDPGNLCTMAHD